MLGSLENISQLVVQAVKATRLVPGLERPMVRLRDIDGPRVAETILTNIDGFGYGNVFNPEAVVQNQRRPLLDIRDRTRVQRIAATGGVLRELENAGALEHPLRTDGTRDVTTYLVADRSKLRGIVAGTVELK